MKKVKFFHSSGNLHGNLQQSNIVLDSEEILFIDFEFSVYIDEIKNDKEKIEKIAHFIGVEESNSTIEDLLEREEEMSVGH